ncbi:DUF5011 domain-containing protein [Mycoplasmatota bacterium]|nr:DUF5011 domain-containing protein [Mycoplasmatota bacterium]
MKKVIFVFILLMFLVHFDKAKADDACVPDNHPTFENVSDFYYEIGQPTPNYIEKITVTDICGNPVLITNESVNVNLVNYDEEGVYTLIYYALETVVTAKVYVFEDIPVIKGLEDFYIEVNSEEVDYLIGVTARDVFNDNDLTASIEVDSSNIDYTKVGTYDLIYSVQDHLGNETVKTVQVHIRDTTKPVIKNYKNLILEVNTDIDNYDFWNGINISDNSLQQVTQTLNLDNLKIGKIGVYEIEYIAIDESNNERRVPIQVQVIDTKKPVLKNISNLSILVNTSIEKSIFTQNITIEDNYDGVISIYHLRVDYHLINPNKPGVYPVLYFVSDSSGNYTEKIIYVTVLDEDKPQILNTGDIRVPLNTESIDYLENISCQDVTDGCLTDQIIVYDDLVNLNEIGTYPLTYIVYDSSGNYDIKQVNVIVYDEENPVITGVTDLIIEVRSELTKAYFLTQVTAFDNNDGDITSSVDVDLDQINFDELGTYQIKYFVSDTSGNIEETYAIVTIVDTTAPQITGYQDLTINLNQEIDETYLLSGLSVIDNYDGDITSLATVKGFYDTSKEGTYIITIEASDSSGNVSEVTFNLIVVIEGQPIQEDKNDYSIFYIVGGIGLSLIGTGFIGYRKRHLT